ncbi:hypothetical protein [Leptospira adleri]|uniref:Uncharacterized protein n=1 Tax=Leptospira adleri TaxID=2023186 RepID=A0A2M9YU51_9LEPT|nr:hypothetical protein [Leptospira adleri]PJZ55036.1 hypothetical protein CH380_00500 [Leptospira adleri]PJZ63738.1 hypothetical protein CH376_01055 [Leptospira adleri]
MFRLAFTKLQLWIDRIWNVNLLPFFQSKNVLIQRRLQPILSEEYQREQIVNPKDTGNFLDQTRLFQENGIPHRIQTDVEIKSETFAGGKQKIEITERLRSGFSNRSRFLIWKSLRNLLRFFGQKPWKKLFSREEPGFTLGATEPDLLSAASPNPYRLYLHSCIRWEEFFPWEEWKEKLPVSWIPFGTRKKIKVRFVAARAASFSKQEFYEESYSPELGFCDVYALGYLRETSDKNVDLEHPESYYIGTFLPSKLERKNLPLWLKERNLLPDPFQWKSSSKEQIFRIFQKEVRFRIQLEEFEPLVSDFIQAGGKQFSLIGQHMHARFFQRAIFTYHPMQLSNRVFRRF